MDRIEKLKDFLKTDPEDSFVQHALALEYIKTGDDKQARELFESIIKIEPGYIGTYYHLAKLLERTGETEEAACSKWYDCCMMRLFIVYYFKNIRKLYWIKNSFKVMETIISFVKDAKTEIYFAVRKNNHGLWINRFKEIARLRIYQIRDIIGNSVYPRFFLRLLISSRIATARI